MAEKQVNLAQGFGTEAFAKYQAAQQAMQDMLAKRENRLFDPTLLAMAQGFLAPTKTGSFGESLGNVAGAVAPIQQAEDKRAIDMAKMRLDLAQQGLQTDIGLRRQQNLADFLKNNTAEMPGAPAAAPATAPAAAPAVQGTNAAAASVMPQAGPSAPSMLPPAPVGALPTGMPPAAPAAPAGPLSAGPSAPPPPMAAPMAAPLSAPMAAAPAAQPPDQQPPAGFSAGFPVGMPGSQPANAKGYNFNSQEANYFRLGLLNDKAPTDLIKEINEQRLKDTVWKEGYGVHIPSNTIYPVPSAEQVEIQLPGEKSPRKVFKSDSMALQHYAATNDPRYRDVLNRMRFGPAVAQAAPGAPGAAPVAAPTIAETAADKARLEAQGKEEGTGAGKRTSAAIDKFEQAIESKNAALSIKDLIAQPNMDLALGVFEKPKIKEAILGMVNDAVFSEDKFRDAYTKTNIKFNIPQRRDEKREEYEQRKQDVYDRAAQVASQAAYLQFQVSMLAKGQGAISNMERQMFANTTVGVRDTVATMNKKADMIIARADFAQKVADKLTDGVPIDQFRKTSEYKKMEKDYENKLRNIWNPTRAQPQTSTAPISKEDLEAARRRVTERLP
jgi:hypothetical protein